MIKTEDVIREEAGKILGFGNTDTAVSGVGQITSFNQLGFIGVKDRPDGWYLPNESTFPAIILEAKSEKFTIKKAHTEELLKNIAIVEKKYHKNIGIVYNGVSVKIYKNGVFLQDEDELKNKEYYLSLFTKNKIDTQKIYNLTARINNNLHFKFGIKNLYHRMVFTACALVAKRYGSILVKGMNYTTFHTSIHTTLAKSFEEARRQNIKLDILLEAYSSIKMNINENQEAINDFIEAVCDISDNINSDFWNGEDVMAIFFNEFNRYKGKSESGQVFTPDHITSLMYKIIDVNKDDYILDAACGSGAFLVKSMCNMIKEAGGNSTDKAKVIKQEQLFGIEMDKEIYALACANMIIHKDGKTNLEQLDARSSEAKAWIRNKKITKVLMNPPFENKYGCLDIVLNVLESVDRDKTCAFIMPDNKLEANIKKAKKILLNHSLIKIIKLPNEIFSGVTTSIFIFKSGIPQNNKKIFACAILEDGLKTIKNQGRQDIQNNWEDIERYWIDVIYTQSGDKTIQWLNPNENLSYKIEEEPFEIDTQDFKKIVLNHLLFKFNINPDRFKNKILDFLLYNNTDDIDKKFINTIKSNIADENQSSTIAVNKWKKFLICGEKGIFNLIHPKPRKSTDYLEHGAIPFVASGAFNNGIEKYVKTDESLDKGGCITVSAIGGFSFYQEKDFIGRGGAGSAIKILYNENLNEKNALFICSVLQKKLSKYDFNIMLSGAKLKKEYITLPINEENKIDWLYMENYINNLYDSLSSWI
ncbi:N-6 DNA methylase [Poseidonibacter ostreae]|uniref:site-specific DNA-methyltransferase (adenine-specific) n=1 Tax=Poseidonibacter ostreae TaxID=2654171 RepID=A0ABQ6VHY5_9BACT|nr:N-6 DNA methylase [Poseidonibacter ostreae]KAB7888066.1 N-6 DNA methylase [Poseidonibacter ostreae]